MSDFDYLGYGQRKQAAFNQYGATAANRAYANTLAQQRGARKKFDIQQQYERDAPRTISRFTQRGLAGPNVQSGVFARGMTDLANRRFDADAAAQREMDESQQQWTKDNAELEAQYNQQIADLEAQKQQQIASAAATLQMFKPFLS